MLTWPIVRLVTWSSWRLSIQHLHICNISRRSSVYVLYFQCKSQAGAHLLWITPPLPLYRTLFLIPSAPASHIPAVVPSCIPFDIVRFRRHSKNASSKLPNAFVTLGGIYNLIWYTTRYTECYNYYHNHEKQSSWLMLHTGIVGSCLWLLLK